MSDLLIALVALIALCASLGALLGWAAKRFKVEGDALVEHGFHVGWHHRQLEAARAQLHRGVALGAAFHTALARQQQDVVVVKNFHEPCTSME